MSVVSKDWEDTFRTWSGPSSPTEQEKQANAERMIREAIRESQALAGRRIEVFAQGSYANNTNVREDSDVDICVRCTDGFFSDFSMADGFAEADVGIVRIGYTYLQLKNDVEAALVAKFGRAGVTRGNKAIDVHENSYRVDADVVPCVEHLRWIRRDGRGGFTYQEPTGAEFWPDNGGSVINWPRQHLENGIAKNEATGGRFKRIVRVLKRLRNEMVEQHVTEADPIASYLIECLAWNVPNEYFGHAQYSDDVRGMLIHTFNGTKSEEVCREWGEVNELKYLFRLGQPWAREEANAFLSAAWRYVGFR